MRSNAVPRIAIAGGGLAGRLLAWRLSLCELAVSLYESGSLSAPGGACWSAAGMISPQSELVHGQGEIYQQGLRSLSLWPGWVAELQAQTNTEVALRRNGSLVLAHPQDSSELTQFHNQLSARLAALAAKLPPPIPFLNSGEIQQLEPALDRFDRGLFLADEADIDNRLLLPALLQALGRQGVALHEQTPVSCLSRQILTPSGGETFDCVVDCRGLGAQGQIKGLRGVRGEVMVVETSEVSLQRPIRLLHPRYQLYAVPRGGNRVIIGATEIESDDMSPISLRSTMELSSALYSLHPAFAEARIIETRVNCRPATMDNLPLIENTPGLLRVNGLYRHGYLLAPALVEQVEKCIQQQVA